MEGNWRGLPRLLDSAVQDLAPAYFALVMATGIVSLAAHAMGIPLLAQLIFWLNGAFCGVLWFLTVSCRVISSTSKGIRS